MPDVFISYKYEERNVAARLAERLTEEGFDVWWDAAVLAGARFEDEIRSMLNACKVAIILWSKASVGSDWVKAEAEIARKRGVALPAFIDDVEPERLPLLFQPMHTADLRGWRGGKSHAGMKEVLEAVRARVGEPSGPTLTPQQAEERLAAGASEAEVWAAITGASEQSADEYRRYLERYGKDARFAELAELRIARLEEGARARRWNWAHFGTLVGGLGTLVGTILAVIVFLGVTPDSIGALFDGWMITDEQRQAGQRCDAWTRSAKIHPANSLPVLEPGALDDCEKAHKAFERSGAYTGHLTLARLSQGRDKGDESVRLVAVGVAKKVPMALYAQAIMYEQGYEYAQNWQRAAELYKQAADLALVPAQARLCGMFVKGYDIDDWKIADPVDPVSLCKDAADKGDAIAQVYLGLIYEAGLYGALKDLGYAAELYGMAAAQGNHIGLHRLGMLHLDGRGTIRDYDRAIDLLKAAADQQDPIAFRMLAIVNEMGLGVERNYVEAGVLYDRALEKGDPIAARLLGYDYDKWGLPRSFVDMIDITSLSGNSNPVSGRLDAYAHYWGIDGKPMDYALAYSAYRALADAGNPFAQLMTGILMLRGHGAAPDDAAAAALYEKVAKQGVVQGQVALASLYENGVGVPYDIEMARYYYGRAAAQGSTYAAQRLVDLAQQPPSQPTDSGQQARPPSEQPPADIDLPLQQTTEALAQ